jgi:hypothetical protein
MTEGFSGEVKSIEGASVGGQVGGLTRRQVVAGGAAVATAAAFGSMGAPAATAALETQEPLSVGYLVGSEQVPDLRRLYVTALRNERRKGTEAIHIVPASDLPGDPRLQGLSVRMAIMGLYPGKNLDKAALPAGIDVDVLSADPFSEKREPLRHYAWTFRAKPWNESPPVRFTSYAEPDRGFGFDVLQRDQPTKGAVAALRVLGGGSGRVPTPAVRRRGWFAFGRESAQPRLQRGIYLLGLAPGVWDDEVILPLSSRGNAAERLSIVVLVDSAVLPD